MPKPRMWKSSHLFFLHFVSNKDLFFLTFNWQYNTNLVSMTCLWHVNFMPKYFYGLTHKPNILEITDFYLNFTCPSEQTFKKLWFGYRRLISLPQHFLISYLLSVKIKGPGSSQIIGNSIWEQPKYRWTKELLIFFWENWYNRKIDKKCLTRLMRDSEGPSRQSEKLQRWAHSKKQRKIEKASFLAKRKWPKPKFRRNQNKVNFFQYFYIYQVILWPLWPKNSKK